MSCTSLRLLMAGALPAMACVSVPALAENLTPDLQMNGYVTAGIASIKNAPGGTTYPNPGQSNAATIQQDPTSDYDSVAGIQFKYHLNDQTDMVTQLVATSQQGQQNNYAVKANWAYLDYHFNDDFTLRAGRFAFSTYMYSENLHVGEAYPWARLPTEIYSQLGGLYSLNGVELLYKHDFGDWTLTAQPNVGNEQLNGYAVNNSTQLAVNLSNDVWTFHAGTGSAQLNLNLTASLGPAAADPVAVSDVNLQHDRGSFSDAGFIYDDAKWFAAGEMGELRIAAWPGDFNAGYISVGHYFGKWLPYVLYAHTKSVNSDEVAPTLPAGLEGEGLAAALAPALQQTTTSIGARYQLKSNVSLKMQLDHINDFGGTNGLFTAAATQPSSVYLYSLSLNAAF